MADADTTTSGALVKTSFETPVPQVDAVGTTTMLVAPNRSIEAANGVTFAYRLFGNADGAALPLVFFQHFRGNIDNWDPALVDAIAERREVILFDKCRGIWGARPRRTR
jgi:hypothetical protein